MLKGLRRKLCAITMALVGCVLVLALGLSLWSAWSAQDGIIAQSLERGLEGELNSVPMIGGQAPHADGGDTDATGGMLALALEISPDGYVLQVSDGPVVINASVLEKVISRVVAGEASGRDGDSHVAWDSAASSDGKAIRIAIVDTRASDASFQRLAARSLLIAAATLAALFLIAWRLAAWSLRPVEDAWVQQRRFVADASHELKTPLSVIIANTEILQKAGVDDDHRRWIDSTAEEAAGMRSLIEDLLQLARADEAGSEQGAGVLHAERVDLSDLVEQAALEFDAVAYERGVTIDEDIEGGLAVEGDPDWLGRVARVLIDNACKYAHAGTAVEVRLASQRKGRAREACLAVTDHGDPIDPADLPHVFDRFWRSDKARTKSGDAGGFGLGLAIAKAVVEAHHGTIGAASSAKDGTTFMVTLPLA